MVVKPKLIILVITACFCLIPTFLQAVIDPTIDLYLPFDEGTGKTAKDLSVFGNHATIKGNGKAKWTAEGKDNSAIEFTSGGYLVVNDADSLDLTTAMTISMWAKLMVKTGECCQGGVEKEPAWQAGEYNLLAEYNGSIPPNLTNLIAWISVCNKDWRLAFNYKTALIATHSGVGGFNLIQSLRIQLNHIGTLVLPRTITVNNKIKFDKESSTEKILELIKFLKY